MLTNDTVPVVQCWQNEVFLVICICRYTNNKEKFIKDIFLHYNELYESCLNLMFINRSHFLEHIKTSFRTFPVVALLGARQCGKSTLAKQYVQSVLESEVHYFDLENPADLHRLNEAQLTLEKLSGLIIIDEIQRSPNLFPVLRYLIDNRSQKYLILGSASRDLIRQSSETLAGRICYLELPPFLLTELEEGSLSKRWLRGGLPRSYLAESDLASFGWRTEYIRTFLERDLAAMDFNVQSLTVHRLWQILAHYHGQILNISEISTNMEITRKTIQNYIDILEGTFMLRQLKPWFENLKKRQIKSPKIYFKDSGLLHTLLGIKTMSDLEVNPKLGASWEGFAMEEIIHRYAVYPDDCYFWGTQGGAELDLLLLHEGKKLGFEFKRTSKPTITKSMNSALQDLNLDHLTIVTPINMTYPLGEKITVLGLDTPIKK